MYFFTFYKTKYILNYFGETISLKCILSLTLKYIEYKTHKIKIHKIHRIYYVKSKMSEYLSTVVYTFKYVRFFPYSSIMVFFLIVKKL